MQNANCMHTIQPGDTLYSLAIRYNTTVSKLLELNPNVEIYNLQIGSTLYICEPIFEKPVPPIGELPTKCDKFRELISLMLCWLAEQFGEDRVRAMLKSICQDWSNGNTPC